MSLEQKDLELIERVIYKNSDDVAVSIARSFVNEYHWGSFKGELCELAERQGTRSGFTTKLEKLSANHARKPTLIERIRTMVTDEAGQKPITGKTMATP